MVLPLTASSEIFIREIRINQNPSQQNMTVGLRPIEILTKPGTDKFRQLLINGNDLRLTRETCSESDALPPGYHSVL